MTRKVFFSHKFNMCRCRNVEYDADFESVERVAKIVRKKVKG
jgi:hypothetical protein